MVTKYIYSNKFDRGGYAADPAATRERFDSIHALMKRMEYIEAKPATMEDIRRVHEERHVQYVQEDDYLFEMALLAAGGCKQAAEIAHGGDPAFALVRPPGHHASAASAWGFCYFNNMSVAIMNLMASGRIDSAFILDFDLHVGDGNINILSPIPTIRIYNPDAENNRNYLELIQQVLDEGGKFDILGISAGFDQYIDDWGGLLKSDDFKSIGKMCKEFSDENCKGRRFAILEGGYNYEDLGKNITAFSDGFKD
ncbi:MAG: histone deacetylase family protein [Promethearchaeota archaeon]